MGNAEEKKFTDLSGWKRQAKYFSKDRIKGRAKLEWLDKNKFTEESPPTAWIHAMIKINASNDFHDNLISKWTSRTNTKGILSNIGLGGRYYCG